MSERLSILCGEERIPYPYFSTYYLAETLGTTVEGIRRLARLERWKAVEREFNEFMDNDDPASSETMWDGMSMPEERRKLIAFNHYRLEEEELPLEDEVHGDVQRLLDIMPSLDFNAYFLALYRARQFAMVKDAVRSLGLGLYDAFEAISGALRIPPAALVEINAALDNGAVCSFIHQDDDVRLTMLLGYYLSFGPSLIFELDEAFFAPVPLQ